MANPRPSSSSGSNSISADKTHTSSREAKLSMLTNAIEITAIGKEFGIIEPVKAAFSAVNAVLTKIKDTMTNKDDFADVVDYCGQICSAIERGTGGKTEGNMSPSFMAAIEELTRTVNDIGALADENSSRTVSSRAQCSDRDKEKISCWKEALYRLLQTFNTELNVTTTTTVEEMHGTLDTVAQDVRYLKELHTAAGSEVFGELPPPPPSVFFGRDELVGEVLNHVQERKHVALIGAGGIGKTSIAKAVLNHPSAHQHFIGGKFFLKCNDFVLSLNRFLGRVAEVVGATISQSAPLASLRSFFLCRTHALLLVLDNAETILESSIQADVVDTIDEIGSCPMVTLLITTRIAALPNNTPWERKLVSPLDLHSSREAFFYVYKHEQSSSAIDTLLIEIDCHPLSINILACAAAQDSLSIDELKQRWDDEKARLLDLGPGSSKQQSLAVSIELSLNSPTIQKVREDALQVMQLVAFLPQGVETTTIQQLVPTVGNNNLIANMLGRLSLTYRQGKFITMLAPIRLYILDTYPPGSPLLAGIRTFYCGKLHEYGISNPGDKIFADGSWICSHDDNIERMISHQLSTVPDESMVKYCTFFLRCIYFHKPRKTTLGAAVKALPDDFLMWKAFSLQLIGHIAIKTGNSQEAREFYNSARNAFLACGIKYGETGCLIDLANLSYNGQRYAEAHTQCTQALTERRDLAAERQKARCQQLLGRIALALGKHSEASEFLTEALESWERQNDMLGVVVVKLDLGRLEFDRGNLEEGRSHFVAATLVLSDLGDNYHIGWCSYQFGRQEMVIRNFPKAIDLLQKAEKVFLEGNSTLEAASCVEQIGCIHYLQKEYSAAKALLTKAKEKFDVSGSVIDLMYNAYYLAWVEFRAGNSQEAKQILKKSEQWFTKENGYWWQAMYARSLGEFAFHEGDKDGAAELFAQAQKAFEAEGLTSQKMDKSIAEEDSEGWRWFRRGRH